MNEIQILADEDNNSKPTDDNNRAIIGNVPMQVPPTNASSTTKIGANMESFTGIFFSTKFALFCWKDNSSYRCNTLGPLCLWQCFMENWLNGCAKLGGGGERGVAVVKGHVHEK